jgi:putative hydrolase of the HAD superfamily
MTPASLAPGSADVLLFDIGNVVLDIDFNRVMRVWADYAGREPAELAARFKVNDIYRHHETGKIEDAVFFENLRQSLGIAISDAQFLEGWNALFSGEIKGISALLPRAAKQLPLYAFSNTNRPHVAHFSAAYPDVLGHFTELYLSSSIGLRKPDVAAFQHVANAIGAPASRIVFFDDSAENIAGARAYGLTAVHVRSIDDVTAAFAALGI